MGLEQTKIDFLLLPFVPIKAYGLFPRLDCRGTSRIGTIRGCFFNQFPPQKIKEHIIYGHLFVPYLIWAASQNEGPHPGGESAFGFL